MATKTPPGPRGPKPGQQAPEPSFFDRLSSFNPWQEWSNSPTGQALGGLGQRIQEDAAGTAFPEGMPEDRWRNLLTQAATAEQNQQVPGGTTQRLQQMFDQGAGEQDITGFFAGEQERQGRLAEVNAGIDEQSVALENQANQEYEGEIGRLRQLEGDLSPMFAGERDRFQRLVDNPALLRTDAEYSQALNQVQEMNAGAARQEEQNAGNRAASSGVGASGAALDLGYQARALGAKNNQDAFLGLSKNASDRLLGANTAYSNFVRELSGGHGAANTLKTNRLGAAASTRQGALNSAKQNPFNAFDPSAYQTAYNNQMGARAANIGRQDFLTGNATGLFNDFFGNANAGVQSVGNVASKFLPGKG